ncbi:hypothetical protein BGZ97_001047, partial [Linnemannia gamsii]
MVLLPTQDELLAIYKDHKKHIVCPRCLQKGRFQRDGFKATTDKTKPAKCNKHYTEAVMEQLLLQAIAKETRKARMKLGGVGYRGNEVVHPQALGGAAAPTKRSVEAIKATAARSKGRTASAKRSEKSSASTCAPETTSNNSQEEATMTAKRAAQTATKDYIRQSLLSDRHFIQSSIELAQCSEEAFLKDPGIILKEKGGDGGNRGGNRGDDDVFEFVMTEGRFQDWMESHARLTGVQFNQDREQVYNQPKSGGMYRGMFWHKHRCSHSERLKSRAALAAQPRLNSKQPKMSAGTLVATAIEHDKQDGGDGKSNDSDTGKEATIRSDTTGGVGGRSSPSRSGCRASIQEALQSYYLPDGKKTTVHVVKYRFRHGHALGFRTRGAVKETEDRMDDIQVQAENTTRHTVATGMTTMTTKAGKESITNATMGSGVGRRTTRSQSVLGFILPPSTTETPVLLDQQLKGAPLLYPSPVSEPPGQSLDDNAHVNSSINSSNGSDREEAREGSPLPELSESFSTLSGSLPDELQQFTACWEEALEDLEKNPTMPNAYVLQEELVQVLTILRREIGENVQLDKLKQRVLRLERRKESTQLYEEEEEEEEEEENVTCHRSDNERNIIK